MLEPYFYKDLNEVPLRWRTYRGARLNLEQINMFITASYRTPLKTEYGDIPDYAAGRKYIEDNYNILNDLWVSKERDD